MKKAILTITGPSLSGKTTLSRSLEAIGSFSVLISHTTRPKRAGEIGDHDYFFVSQEQFDQIEFVERVAFNGHRYGMSRHQIEDKLKEGLMPVIVVEPNGAREIDAYCKANNIQCFKVFLNTPLDVRMSRWLERVDRDGPDRLQINLNRLKSMIEDENHWHLKSGVRWDLVVGAHGASGHDPMSSVYLISGFLDVPLRDLSRLELIARYDESVRGVSQY